MKRGWRRYRLCGRLQMGQFDAIERKRHPAASSAAARDRQHEFENDQGGFGRSEVRKLERAVLA